jgi:hypothetical protein
MPDEASRVLDLAGLRVTGVIIGDDDALDLEVESVVIAAYCLHSGGRDLVVKEQPVMGGANLSVAGRVAAAVAKAPPALSRLRAQPHRAAPCPSPAPARESDRFRARLGERAAGGGAHAGIAREERTSRYQVARGVARVGMPTSEP